VGWLAGSSIDGEDTFSFSVLSGVRSMNEVFPLESAAEAFDLMMSGKARFISSSSYNRTLMIFVNTGERGSKMIEFLETGESVWCVNCGHHFNDHKPKLSDSPQTFSIMLESI
jgi:hypothetical protein